MAKVMGKKAEKTKRGATQKRQAEAEDRAPERTSNSKARREIIREVCREVEQLEAKRDAISDEIRRVKQTKIKGALDLKIADFNAALRIYKLGRDDRAEMLETMQETFKALGIGQTLDWVAAAAETDRKVIDKDEAERTAALKIAEQDGYEAGKAGKWPKDNPHSEESPLREVWEANRLKGQSVIANSLGAGAPGNA